MISPSFTFQGENALIKTHSTVIQRKGQTIGFFNSWWKYSKISDDESIVLGTYQDTWRMYFKAVVVWPVNYINKDIIWEEKRGLMMNSMPLFLKSLQAMLVMILLIIVWSHGSYWDWQNEFRFHGNLQHQAWKEWLHRKRQHSLSPC